MEARPGGRGEPWEPTGGARPRGKLAVLGETSTRGRGIGAGRYISAARPARTFRGSPPAHQVAHV